MRPILLILVSFLSAHVCWAQYSLSGTVTTRDTDEMLPGASVVIEGFSRGTTTDLDGHFLLSDLSPGTYTVTASFVGYKDESQVVTVRSADVVLNFEIEATSVALEGMEVFASRALEQRTPVAFTTLGRARLQRDLGSRDVPLVLNSTPSVYSTVQGGGAGDARVNVRGFNQRNVAIMINGVPVNDMENGWLYWSNWDGLEEVTNSIQLQRGLSVVTLATPSIGGTMNILTDPARNVRQVLLKQEFGNDGLRKSTLMLSSGLIDGKVAVTVSGIRKTGRGYVDGTWTDMWSYYAAVGWNASGKHRFDFFAIGSPQRHGQNLFRQNIAAYDHGYARKVFERDGLDAATISEILQAYPERGRRWNQNIGAVSETYSRDQHNGFEPVQRKNSGYMDEFVNFFHKPILSLSHFGQLTEKSLLSTIVYYSGGKGGGSSRHGDLILDQSGPSPVPNYDASIEANKKNGLSLGIIRNRHNVQWTLGAISKLTHQVNDRIELEAGLDWRSAEIQHFSTVRDLLGGQGYLRFDNDFWGSGGRAVQLGERFDYNDFVTVNWIGGFLQGRYEAGSLSSFAVVGYSRIKYTFEDFFTDDGNGRPFTASPSPIGGYQVKGGANYRLNEVFSVYASIGRVSKVPVFDGVIDAISGSVNPDPQNESFIGVESGLNFRSLDRRVTAKLNLYHTMWNDRTVTRNLVEQSGNDELVNITGLNARHRGVEGELAWQPVDFVRLDGAFSVGDWKYTDDVSGTYTLDRSNPDSQEQISLPLSGVKVGDAPQTQLAYAITAFPRPRMHIVLTGRSYAKHFADFDPAGYSERNSTVWEAPGYTVFDLKAGYEFDRGRFGVRLFLHVFNIANTFYVQDAVNNSRFHAYTLNGTNMGRADDAEVFLGLPRTFNFGTRVTFR
jgi:outer membrane cobalamin receptor